MTKTRRVRFSRKRRRGGRKTVKRRGGRRRSRVNRRGGKRRSRVTKRRGGRRRSRMKKGGINQNCSKCNALKSKCGGLNEPCATYYKTRSNPDTVTKGQQQALTQECRTMQTACNQYKQCVCPTTTTTTTAYVDPSWKYAGAITMGGKCIANCN